MLDQKQLTTIKHSIEMMLANDVHNAETEACEKCESLIFRPIGHAFAHCNYCGHSQEKATS